MKIELYMDEFGPISVIESNLDFVHRLVGSSNFSDWIGVGSFLFSWFLKQKNSLLVPGGLLVRAMGR